MYLRRWTKHLHNGKTRTAGTSIPCFSPVCKGEQYPNHGIITAGARTATVFPRPLPYPRFPDPILYISHRVVAFALHGVFCFRILREREVKEPRREAADKPVIT